MTLMTIMTNVPTTTSILCLIESIYKGEPKIIDLF